MVVVAVFGLYGAATGRLAPMLAAIFDPKGLSPSAPYKPPEKQTKQQISQGGNFSVNGPYDTQQECENTGLGICVKIDGKWYAEEASGRR